MTTKKALAKKAPAKKKDVFIAVVNGGRCSEREYDNEENAACDGADFDEYQDGFAVYKRVAVYEFESIKNELDNYTRKE